VADAARAPTAAERRPIVAIMRAQTPPAWRPISQVRVRVSTRARRVAIATVGPAPGHEQVVQSAYAFLARRGPVGRLLDLGSSGVGCGRVPQRVRVELMHSVGLHPDLGC
jgi:hypothetical protein